MFRAATGADWSEDDFNTAAERVVNLERAIEIKRQGRSRGDDEYVIPYFQHPDSWVNSFIGEKQSLDESKFREILTDFYVRRGWDPATGRPKRDKLESLGLGDVADTLEAQNTVPA
jgi:aldehyde:ferredoxin oxidoreductase